VIFVVENVLMKALYWFTQQRLNPTVHDILLYRIKAYIWVVAIGKNVIPKVFRQNYFKFSGLMRTGVTNNWGIFCTLQRVILLHATAVRSYCFAKNVV